ncbi:MAG: zinc ABC transporter substrate-binding protein [Alphaproteobacteria bacterium]|nr:zinc ABC transporter substrate-binding protein [Alphaproteobacteria bacterium]
MKTYLYFLLSWLFLTTAEAAPMKVVTTFSILMDLVKQVGGEDVSVQAIVGPNEDAHVFDPTPQHSLMIANADIVFVNGLGLEGWIDRLIEASGFTGPIVTVSNGINSLQSPDNATPDPHAWHSIPAVMIYIDNIATALSKKNPENASKYFQRATSFKQRLRLLNEWIIDEVDKIDPKKRKVITAHDAFQYFAKEYKIQFLAPVGISTQTEPTPRAVLDLIRLIQKENIKIIFVENITNEKQMHMIRESTNARIGGTLYSDALSTSDGPASDYISLMKHNVGLIVKAMNY